MQTVSLSLVNKAGQQAAVGEISNASMGTLSELI